MRLYVVWEQDRGAGETILDVFTDADEAKKLCGESAHYAMQEVMANGVKPTLSEVLAEIKSALYGVHGLVGLLCYNRVEKILSKYFA